MCHFSKGQFLWLLSDSGDTHGTTVTFRESIHGDQSSNPEQGSLHYFRVLILLRKSMNLTTFPHTPNTHINVLVKSK